MLPSQLFEIAFGNKPFHSHSVPETAPTTTNGPYADGALVTFCFHATRPLSKFYLNYLSPF